MNWVGTSALLALIAVAAMAGPVGWIALGIGLAALLANTKPK